MRTSRNAAKSVVWRSCLGILLCCACTRMSFARAPLVVRVEIESELHVGLPHTVQLTFHIPPVRDGRPVTISFNSGAIQVGAGLVVEHIAPDGTRSKQSLPPADWWFTQTELLEIKSRSLPTQFSLWVNPGQHLSFVKLGIFRISYLHPWASRDNDPNNLIFASNTLTIACVSPQRYDQLHLMLREKPELALASYRFKNPPVNEFSKYTRARSVDIIDEAIQKGTEQDEVLLLLGSPDRVSYESPGATKRLGWEETWFYETSPAGGYHVHFKNSSIAAKGADP